MIPLTIFHVFVQEPEFKEPVLPSYIIDYKYSVAQTLISGVCVYPRQSGVSDLWVSGMTLFFCQKTSTLKW